jgi:hypothetical protein
MSPLDRLEDTLVKAQENGIDIRKMYVSQDFFDHLANLCWYQLPPTNKLLLGPRPPKKHKKLIYSWAGGEVVIKVRR